MRVDISSCETSKCDPQIVIREKDGLTYYGLRMRFQECEGVQDHHVTFWAKSIPDLYVFTVVMQEKVQSHIAGTPSEPVKHV
jgi:hypothetical protein